MSDSRPQPRSLRTYGIAAAVALGLALAATLLLWPREDKLQPQDDSSASFVDPTQCAQCHQKEVQAWRGSHHDKAMAIANEANVLGNFNDVTFTHNTVSFRFFKKDARYYVHTLGPDGVSKDFEIKYTFGVDPLQQYLIELERGHIQCLTVAWDVQGKKWFHLHPEKESKPGDAQHWTGAYNRWNSMCAECHSTHLQKNYNPRDDSYSTSFAEINVGCQACHGPASKHIAWIESSPEEQKKDPLKGFAINFKETPSAELQSCARCHSRRNQVSPDDAHGRPFYDDFMPETLRPGLYYPDGQILDEVYVYGSYLQSRMHSAGIRCSACHDPHSARLTKPGNQLCTQCHTRAPNPAYPQLKAKNYNAKSHHFHSLGKAGSKCVDCHMPSRVYHKVDPRHDHKFSIPRPDLTERIGVPNACNQCHKDKSPDWAATTMVEWYGAKVFQRPSFAIAFKGGREGHPLALASLLKRVKDSTQPSIVRATALELLGQYGEAALKFITESLQDPDPLIRVSAMRGLSQLDLEARIKYVTPLLKDPIRGARLETVPVLSVVPTERWSKDNRALFEEVLKEYEALQRANSDLPVGPFNLAVVYAQLGRSEEAIAEYKKALAIDRQFLPAILNLVRLHGELGQGKEAEAILRESLKYSPKNGDLHYSLGLILGEQERWAEARVVLDEAARLLPDRPRVLYNFAMVLQKVNALREAEAPILKARRLDPRDPQIHQAHIVLMIQLDRWDEAKALAEELVRNYPEHPPFKELLEQIKKDMK